MALIEMLANLKANHGVVGLKTEFEAEGATFREVMLQRIWTLKAGLPLHLKIGGVEAIRDLKDAKDLDVDGLIAPMVESPFALKKFIHAVHRVFGPKRPKLFINIETVTGYKNLAGILDQAQGEISGITIGRTDLTGSLLNGIKDTNDEAVFSMVQGILSEVIYAGLEVTLGGSLNAATLAILLEKAPAFRKITKLETRKIVFDADFLLRHQDSLKEGLDFERQFLALEQENSSYDRDFRNQRMESLSRRI
jgi:hypothetical protein